MDDYNSFRHAHEVEIKKWRLYWSPDYVSIIKICLDLINGVITSNSSVANGSKSASGSVTTKSGGFGTIESGGFCLFINT
jgi:hypothetical protein